MSAAEPSPPTSAADAASRRDFVGGAGSAAIAAVTVGVGLGSLRLAAPNVRGGDRRRLRLGRAADFRVGTLTWLRDPGLFVLRRADGIGVFSTRCTHLGCTIRRTSSGFACPCHGARFDAWGRALAGPARRNLPWYRAWLEADGTLWVDLSTQVETGTLAEAARAEAAS